MSGDLRGEVAAGRQALRESYLRRPDPRALLTQHSQLIDRTVQQGVERDRRRARRRAGRHRRLRPRRALSLLRHRFAGAAGQASPTEAERETLERLIGRFWDIGLEIGHSVRTVEGCIEAAASDITVRTTLLEARFLAGSREPVPQADDASARARSTPAAFFKAKKLEQEQRHAKHQDSPYSLEPNLKEAPGGLRDLQVIQWIARAQRHRHGAGATWWRKA